MKKKELEEEHRFVVLACCRAQRALAEGNAAAAAEFLGAVETCVMGGGVSFGRQHVARGLYLEKT